MVPDNFNLKMVSADGFPLKTYEKLSTSGPVAVFEPRKLPRSISITRIPMSNPFQAVVKFRRNGFGLEHQFAPNSNSAILSNGPHVTGPPKSQLFDPIPVRLLLEKKADREFQCWSTSKLHPTKAAITYSKELLSCWRQTVKCGSHFLLPNQPESHVSPVARRCPGFEKEINLMVIKPTTSSFPAGRTIADTPHRHSSTSSVMERSIFVQFTN